jgi:hypothetical protein
MSYFFTNSVDAILQKIIVFHNLKIPSYIATNGEEKETFLDDNDELWSEMKYMHIAPASKYDKEEIIFS